MRSTFVFCVSSLLCSSAFAQQSLSVDEMPMQVLQLPAVAGTPFQVDVNVDGTSFVLDLEPYSLRADGFVLQVQQADGRITFEQAPEPLTYRGAVMGLAGSEVRASLIEGELHATIRDGFGTRWGVQPASSLDGAAPHGVHAVYRHDQIERMPADFCGTDTSDYPVNGGAPSPGVAGLRMAEIAVDTDREYYQSNGSSVNNTLNDVETIFNGVESIYEDDVNCTFEITTVIVRTSEPDPYSTSDASALLGQVSSEWILNQNGWKRDVVHLLSGKNLNGGTIGIAGLGTLCSAFGLSQTRFSNNLTRRIGLTAHEVGHNFGAPHCNGAGSGCNIMCDNINLFGCPGGNLTEFAPVSVNQITNQMNSVSCLLTLAPVIAAPFIDDFESNIFDTDTWIMIDAASLSTAGIGEPSGSRSMLMTAKGPDAKDEDEIRTNCFDLDTGNWFLSYYSQHVSVEAGEQLIIDYLNSSNDWITLAVESSDGVDEDSFSLITYSLPNAAEYDRVRFRFRTSMDSIDDNWFVDDFQITPFPPCEIPSAYCVGKLNTDGCVPVITYTGMPSASGSQAFNVDAFLVLSFKAGLMFYGYDPASLPFLGGTLCVQPPLRRTTVQPSGGDTLFPCSGSFSYDMGALITSGLDAGLLVGNSAYAQYWYRDPGTASGSGLSNGLEFEICQ